TGSLWSNSPVCIGDTLRLVASILAAIGVDYTWTGPSPVTVATYSGNVYVYPATYNDTGVYKVVTVAPYTGCLSDTAQIHVTVTASHQTMVRVAVGPNDTVCEGKTVWLTAMPTAGEWSPQYQWHKNALPIPGTNSSTSLFNAVTQEDFY